MPGLYIFLTVDLLKSIFLCSWASRKLPITALQNIITFLRTALLYSCKNFAQNILASQSTCQENTNWSLGLFIWENSKLLTLIATICCWLIASWAGCVLLKWWGEEGVLQRRNLAICKRFNCSARTCSNLGPFVYDLLRPTYFVFGKFLKNCAYHFKTYASAFKLVGFIICFFKLKIACVVCGLNLIHLSV